MNAETFLVLTGFVLLVTIVIGIFIRPAPTPPKKPPPNYNRWATFRLHVERLIQGGAPAVEALPGGLVLSSRVRGKKLFLLDPGKKERVQIQVRWGFGRKIVRILIDRRQLAEFSLGKRKGRPEIIQMQGVDFQMVRGAGGKDFEARRGGKLLASISPDIATLPGATGVEILTSEDPLPILAMTAALGFLQILSYPPIQPAGQPQKAST